MKLADFRLPIAGALAACLALMPAHAQDQVIEEIVVTAEKREESLQDVSVSVTALNEEALELGGIDDVSRLELLVPGLNYAFAGNRRQVQCSRRQLH